jgi:hypothetical protein
VSRRKNMCPNSDCARHGEPTGLMGGCECGAPLVPYAAPEPTNEQLENFMLAFDLPVMPGAFERSPEWREAALSFHHTVQASLNGDREAERRVQFILDRFRMAA